MEDLERILPDKIRQVGSRKFILIEGSVILVLVVIVIALAAVLGARSGTKDDACVSVECLHIAGLLADNMDYSVGPCQDFHQFACGGFQSRHHLAPDEKEVTMLDTVEEEIEERLREVIENPRGGKPRTKSEEKLRVFFLSCVNDYARMQEGGKVLVKLLLEKLGGWYLLDPTNWNQNRTWNLQMAIEAVQGDLLASVFFEAYTGRDYRNKLNILVFHPPFTEYRMSFRLDDQTGVLDAYKDYMNRTAMLLLRDANVTLTPSEAKARVDQFVSDAFDIEYRLVSEIRSLNKQGRIVERSTTTLGELDRNFTQLNWLKVVERMFEDINFTKESKVQLYSKSFFSTINEILLNETEPDVKDRQMNNFLAWRIAYRYSRELSLEYLNPEMRFKTIMYGQREMQPTWKTCMRTIRFRLGTLLATEFVRAHMGPDVRHQVNEMFTDIRSAVLQRISELVWMDKTTQQKATEKVNSVKVLYGFNEMYYNESAMEELHSMLNFSDGQSYFRNLLSVNRFQRRMEARLLIDVHACYMEHLPLVGSEMHYWVKPYFFDYENTLLIPAGSMLDPIYNAKRPQVVNYGLLGTRIAGELIKAVGDPGRYFWSNGSRVDWWSNETSFRFTSTNECFVKYFGSLTVGPFVINDKNFTVNVNGTLQTAKLMDDLGGIRAALRAYKEWTRRNGKEALPTGSSLTPDQLFFQSAAQTKCYLRTEEEAYGRAREGTLPEDIELNSLLSHMPEFSATFGCATGSKMRNDNQCETY